MRRVAGLSYRTLAFGVAVVVLAGLILGSAGLGNVAGAVSHAAKGHSSSPAAHASPTTAGQGIKTTTVTIGLVYTPGLTFPGNATFWTNVTWGTISNTNAKAAVIATGAVTDVATGNGTVVAGGVTSFNNNGVPTSNYTWTVPLTEASLGCADASCSDLIGGSIGSVTFTIWVWVNGASSGGGVGTNTYSWAQSMQSTYSTSVFSSPLTSLATFEANPFPQPMNMTVVFAVNTSYMALSNATLSLSLNVSIYGATPLFANLTLNNTLNTTNLWGGSSSIIDNGTSYTGWFSNVSYSLNLDATTLGLASWADLVADLGPNGGYMFLEVWVTADGTSVGGIAPGINFAGASVAYTGTTLWNANTVSSPAPFQALPFTLSGYANVSWVNPNPATGNATVFGWVNLYDNNLTGAFATISLNDSVNTTNAAGASLMVHDNGTTAEGVPFINYTWSIVLTSAMFAPTAYGDLISVAINVSADGTSLGAVNNSIAAPDILLLGPTTFAQNPTTVSTTFTTTGVTGYIDVSSAPFLLNWTLTTNSAISPTVTSVELQVVDATIPYPIMNYTIAVAPGQTNFSFPLTAATFSSCDTQVCGVSSPTDDFYFTVNAVENGVYGPTNGSVASSTSSIGPAFFIATPATITLLSPNGAAPTLPAGNVTFTTLYAGNFVSGANLSVYSGTVVVFTASMTQLTAGVPATAVWKATAAGTYNVVVTMTRTSGGPVYANQTLTITSSTGSLTYQNSSTYHNVTLLGSLSPAVAGTILLLVGLIVGMIVALLVGRMMWGGSKPQEPPQQWEQGQQPAAGGTTDSGTGSMDAGSGSMDSGSPPSGSS
jgi:hypothetical protein